MNNGRVLNERRNSGRIEPYRPPRAGYQEVRSATGKLLFKFDWQRGLVEIKDGRELHVVDLARYGNG